jgi:hypothetical protein
MSDQPWRPSATAPQDIDVETAIIDDLGQRNTATLRRIGRLWFLPDGSMYVYYTPTHWRPLPSKAADGAL